MSSTMVTFVNRSTRVSSSRQQDIHQQLRRHSMIRVLSRLQSERRSAVPALQNAISNINTKRNTPLRDTVRHARERERESPCRCWRENVAAKIEDEELHADEGLSRPRQSRRVNRKAATGNCLKQLVILRGDNARRGSQIVSDGVPSTVRGAVLQ